MKLKSHKPELMSPAGHFPQLRAAVEAGADAVFFGLNEFSARAKVGFDLTELPETMRYLHSRGVQGFLTFNTLVFDRELKKAEETLMGIAASGVDAIIVQDMGIAQLAHAICPELAIHGSTQMSITSAEGAEFARALGVSRVVLGRELSLTDMERIAKNTDIELEVFVHGALCVSYSGQCFSSEAWGGRSANRGQCAQACRLPYELMVDDQPHPTADARYLLSPGDLYTVQHIPKLMELGIDCFKIEGRYKEADYVYLTTRAYRKAIDAAWEGKTYIPSLEEEQELTQVYSRGLGDYFMGGVNHQRVVEGRAPRHRGVKLGVVQDVRRNSVVLSAEVTPNNGDGVVFDAAHRRSPEQKEEGGNIYHVHSLGNNLYELEFGDRDIHFERIAKGDWLWRTAQPSLKKKLKPVLEAEKPLHTRAVTLKVSGKVGTALSLTMSDEQGNSATVHSPEPLQAALNKPLNLEQLSKLGGTAFHALSIENHITEPVFLPLSAVNALRREAVEHLLQHKSTAKPRAVRPALAKLLPSPATQEHVSPQLHLLVRNPEQLQAAIGVRPASITLDYLELYGLKPSVQQVKDAGIAVRVASPRILKPTEQNIAKFLTALDAEILVRSTGLLHSMQAENTKLSGDFSLNAANVLSSQHYLDSGLERITPTHDLNSQQIAELARGVGGKHLEVIAYQHLPVFHTEHCVFCRFLSQGTDYTNCGHPCEKHRVALQDKQGRQHPVMADVGCRNTVFGAEAQSAVHELATWQQAGIAHYRLEFVHENAEQVSEISRAYQHTLISGETTFLIDTLKQYAPQGTTSGSLFVPPNFDDLPELVLL